MLGVHDLAQPVSCRTNYTRTPEELLACFYSVSVAELKVNKDVPVRLVKDNAALRELQLDETLLVLFIRQQAGLVLAEDSISVLRNHVVERISPFFGKYYR